VLALTDTFPVDSLLAVIASTFVVIFVAELPDKTALAALALATRYRTADVIVGAWSALLVQTVIAVTVGGLISALPTRPIHLAAGLSFLVFAGLAWRRDEAAQAAEERAGIRAAQASRRGAVMSSFVVVLAAEFGDLTQLATAALAGRHAAGFASGRTLSRASAVLFGVAGLVLLSTTLTGS
jgi:putative Ca2+/H+ antiporter (TMEM165/GDT1 family)